MKPVQVMMDETLLRMLDATDEVRRNGRSAVLREAAAEYLQRRERQDVRERYRRAYTDGHSLGEDLAGWEEQGAWPDE